MKYLAIMGFVGASCILTNIPGSANAGGLIGDVVNHYVPGAGTVLDSGNRRLRNEWGAWNDFNEYFSPATHPMARARQYPPQQPSTAYPGGGGPPQYGDPAYSPPSYGPLRGYAPPPPAYAPPPPVVWGQYCQTNMGIVGPGRPKPVGSPCWVDTHLGRVFGRMI